MEKINSSTAMKTLCCVSDLICFMMNEAENLIKGSVTEDDFFIVHDALVLILAKEKIIWVRKNGYLHIWLFPLDGLQNGTAYSGCTVSNISEFLAFR